jgi:hypothetical protein
MSKSRSIICLSAALTVVASGCGGASNTVVTTVTSAPSTPSTPGPEASNTGGTGTSSEQAQHAGTASQPSAAAKTPETSAHREQKPSKRGTEAAKPTSGSPAPTSVPPKRRYPRSVHFKFLSSCQAAQGSPSSCECVVVKQELRPVEKPQSIAELIILEAALAQGITLEQAARHRIPLPEGVQRSLVQCKIA